MFLIYILRHDLRISDNPILHALSSAQKSKFTHLLPVYVLSPQQIEVSGFLADKSSKSPYPETRSRIGKFWRCGPHRAKFLAEAVFDLKTSLRKVNSDLIIRIGPLDKVVGDLLESEEFKGQQGAVWMTREWASEEMAEERKVEHVVRQANQDWKLWDGEDTLIHEEDLPMKPSKLPDVFSTFRKTVEPLRRNVREPYRDSIKHLPPLPKTIPTQGKPFILPDSLREFIEALQRPLDHPPSAPGKSAHPFTGGETQAHKRVSHLLSSGAMSRYKDTRNGMVGEDFSTKLSAYLALGCITARQVNAQLVAFEDGKGSDEWTHALGYGRGENKGTAAVRFELLWRDYMRLCMRKYGTSLFSLYGFHGQQRSTSGPDKEWKSPQNDSHTARIFERFLSGTTGTGLIDASMRELNSTGYTSNRARQNVASFLATWLGIDWRLGAEWYESQLIDYDVASNWGNWQYVAGVGNDPRGSGQNARRFNPVKQSWDYDKKGEYVKHWVEELRDVQHLDGVFQAWKAKNCKGELAESEMVRNPLIRIQYSKRK